MLVLSRKPGEKVITSNGITVTVAELDRNRVRLGFEAPAEVRILRAELASRLEQWPAINGADVAKNHRQPAPEPFSRRSERVRADNDPTAAGDIHFEHAPRPPTTNRLLPKTERTKTLKIVTFTAGQVRLDNVIATELEGLTDDLGECHLLLDFTNVEYITSVELGTLVSLHKKMEGTGGRLTLFNLNLQVFEVFAVTHLDELLGICR